jgi:hypothetical protein
MKKVDRTFQPRLATLGALTGYALFCKLLPYILFQFGVAIDPERTAYPWNFSPVPAICLFTGAFFKDVRWAFGVPLAAWFLGDLGILALVSREYGFKEGLGMAFYPDQFFVYLGFAIVVGCGMLIRALQQRMAVKGLKLSESGAFWPAVFGAGFAGSVIFYVLTNFTVWAFGEGMIYPLTAEGLFDCYVKALPFFRNFAIATAGFSLVLFSTIGTRMLEDAEERVLAPETA